MELTEEMKKSIELKINGIIEETTQYDFPFFASYNKKEEIIMAKKKCIEKKFNELLPDCFPNEEKLNELWIESINYSDKQFHSLAEKYKLNGFYLQELMHCYAGKIANAIMNNI